MGVSIYDFLTPSPPYHIHKSADFVPFFCFFGNPLPPPTADVIYESPYTKMTSCWEFPWTGELPGRMDRLGENTCIANSAPLSTPPAPPLHNPFRSRRGENTSSFTLARRVCTIHLISRKDTCPNWGSSSVVYPGIHCQGLHRYVGCANCWLTQGLLYII